MVTINGENITGIWMAALLKNTGNSLADQDKERDMRA